ncbi:hypothetical protein RJ498_000826 [Pluralibacter gergoviae]
MGKFSFSDLTGISPEAVVTTNSIFPFFSDALFGLVLTLGAEVSIAVYTSLKLKISKFIMR